MGWSSGSELFSEIIFSVKSEVKDNEARKRIYRHLIRAFEDQDWDTQDECCGEDDAYDAIFEEEYGYD